MRLDDRLYRKGRNFAILDQNRLNVQRRSLESNGASHLSTVANRCQEVYSGVDKFPSVATLNEATRSRFEFNRLQDGLSARYG